MTSSNLGRRSDTVFSLSPAAFRTAWVMILIAVCLTHCLTLKISPPLWVDEAQIIEHGRLAFTGTATDWSMNWFADGGRPVMLWAYLGPAMQELLFRATMPLPTGPRLGSLLGAAVAASALAGWLISMEIGYGLSLLLGTLCLVDPLFVQSYRGGRVDSWALAACLGSCWLLRLGLSRMQAEKPYSLQLISSGFLAMTAFFVWPSAALCYPFVIAELGVVLHRQYLRSRRLRGGALRSLLFLAGGVLLAAVVCVVPVRHMFGDMLKDGFPVVKAGSLASNLGYELRALLRGFVFSPLLFIGTVAGLLFAPRRPLTWAAVVVYAYVLSTWVYADRLVYIVPYAAALIGISLQAGFSEKMKRYRTALYIGLGTLLGASLLISLVIRPAIALWRSESRNPDALFGLGREAIGTGPHRVYIDAWEFYFVGRQLGWRMFHPYEEKPDEAQLLRVFSIVDLCVFRQDDITRRLAATLEKAGLHPIRTLAAGSSRSTGSFIDDLGGKGYGPYVLFGRAP